MTALNVFLSKPQKVKGSVLIRKHDYDIYGSYVIPKDVTTEVHVDFDIGKKHIRRENQSVYINIEFQDPIDKLHKLKRIEVKPIKKASVKKEVKLKVEDPTQLTSKIEKQVVAVLKNEVQQYKVRGRREGKL